MSTRITLPLLLFSLLLFSLLSTPILASSTADDDDVDLSFLEEPESDDAVPVDHPHSDAEFSEAEDEDFENYDDFDVPSDFAHGEDGDDEVAAFDEKDVVILADRNFSTGEGT